MLQEREVVDTETDMLKYLNTCSLSVDSVAVCPLEFPVSPALCVVNSLSAKYMYGRRG